LKVECPHPGGIFFFHSLEQIAHHCVKIRIAGDAVKLQNKFPTTKQQECEMNSIIYLVGLVVVVMFVLGLLGLR
jgi:hypothetical protein